MLNTKGSFCFITSNSWLDVGYGRNLQEFLLKHCHVKMVLDNQVERSFASADVNTIIVLFSAPDERHERALDKTARFVMFKVPFEHILSPIIFDEIESARDRSRTQECRIYPIAQKQLLLDGWEWPDDVAEEAIKKFGFNVKGSKYSSNKWGGKYLRAPDIYWTILEKGKGKLVRLRDIAKVRFGIKTGANEFFYLDAEKIKEWGIEKEFLKPVIKSPRECKRILIDPKDLKNKIFMCHEDKKDLKDTAALDYIKWGESQGFNKRPSCAGRARWWDVGLREPGLWAWPYIMRERIFAPYNPTRQVFFDCNLFDIYPMNNDSAIGLFLNSSIQNLQLELTTRSYGGGGGPIKTQVYELTDMLALCNAFDIDLKSVFKTITSQEALPISMLIEDVSRRSLDNIIFDILGLTQGERDAVYEAVINLVEARLKKADSLKD